jgi:hypothetical protein
MNLRLLVLAMVAATLTLPAAVAKAKGLLPSSASISGPGISQTLHIDRGRTGRQAFLTLLGQTGFFPAVTPEDVRPMLPGRPRGTLGPKYTIRYLLLRRPPVHPQPFHITQDLYPYAVGGAVTYMKPGQPFVRSRGGWFRGGVALKQTLVQYGLPSRPPSNSTASSNLSFLETVLASAPIVLLLAGAAALFARRRRRRAHLSVRARPA